MIRYYYCSVHPMLTSPDARIFLNNPTKETTMPHTITNAAHQTLADRAEHLREQLINLDTHITHHNTHLTKGKADRADTIRALAEVEAALEPYEHIAETSEASA